MEWGGGWRWAGKIRDPDIISSFSSHQKSNTPPQGLELVSLVRTGGHLLPHDPQVRVFLEKGLDRFQGLIHELYL